MAAYTALVPRQSLTEVNVKVGDIKGPFSGERKRAARASARMDFGEPANQPYGGRTGTVQDPFGNTWYLSSQTKKK